MRKIETAFYSGLFIGAYLLSGCRPKDSGIPVSLGEGPEKTATPPPTLTIPLKEVKPQETEAPTPAIYKKIETKKPVLFLTVDICPRKTMDFDWTFFKKAEELNIPLTVFISGRAVNQLTQDQIRYLQELQKKGLIEVGSHGFDHLLADEVSLESWKQEVNLSVKTLTPLFGKSRFFRYPGDEPPQHSSLEKQQVVADQKMIIISHSFATGDPDPNITGGRIYNEFTKRAQPGLIILGHANIASISRLKEALPQIANWAKTKDFVFGRLSDFCPNNGSLRCGDLVKGQEKKSEEKNTMWEATVNGFTVKVSDERRVKTPLAEYPDARKIVKALNNIPNFKTKMERAMKETRRWNPEIAKWDNSLKIKLVDQICFEDGCGTQAYARNYDVLEIVPTEAVIMEGMNVILGHELGHILASLDASEENALPLSAYEQIAEIVEAEAEKYASSLPKLTTIISGEETLPTVAQPQDSGCFVHQSQYGETLEQIIEAYGGRHKVEKMSYKGKPNTAAPTTRLGEGWEITICPK